jgi:hypothetical protein
VIAAAAETPESTEIEHFGHHGKLRPVPPPLRPGRLA